MSGVCAGDPERIDLRVHERTSSSNSMDFDLPSDLVYVATTVRVCEYLPLLFSTKFSRSPGLNRIEVVRSNSALISSPLEIRPAESGGA